MVHIAQFERSKNAVKNRFPATALVEEGRRQDDMNVVYEETVIDDDFQNRQDMEMLCDDTFDTWEIEVKKEIKSEHDDEEAAIEPSPEDSTYHCSSVYAVEDEHDYAVLHAPSTVSPDNKEHQPITVHSETADSHQTNSIQQLRHFAKDLVDKRKRLRHEAVEREFEAIGKYKLFIKKKSEQNESVRENEQNLKNDDLESQLDPEMPTSSVIEPFEMEVEEKIKSDDEDDGVEMESNTEDATDCSVPSYNTVDGEHSYAARHILCTVSQGCNSENIYQPLQTVYHILGQKFPCFECDLTFRFKENLQKHISVVHNSIAAATAVDESDQKFSCNWCWRIFYDEVRLHVHELIHTSADAQKYTCSECDMRFKYKYWRQKHIRMVHGREAALKLIKAEAKITCPTCSKCFSNRWQLRIHEKIHCPQNKYPCSECDMRFKYRYSLQKHFLLVHGQEVEVNEITHPTLTLSEITRPSVYCAICNKTFCDVAQLRVHELIHRIEVQKYPCPECNMMFKFKNERLNHIRLVHERELALKCIATETKITYPTCGKCFHSSWKLRKQEKIHSLEPQKYSCSDCVIVFDSEKSRQTHIRYSDAHRLETASRCAAVDKQTKVSCQTCGKRVRDAGHLRLHEKIHVHKAQIFPCSKCDIVFHSKKSHLMHICDNHRRARSPKCAAADKKSKVYNCPTGSKCFRDSWNLRSREKVHSGEPQEYPCSECSMTFKLDYNRQRHICDVHECKAKIKSLTDNRESIFSNVNNIVDNNNSKFSEPESMPVDTGSKVSDLNSITDDTKFSCPVCSKCFHDAYLLRKHKDFCHRHIYESKPKYPCSECEMAFSRKNCRQKHIYDVHGSEAALKHVIVDPTKKFTCPICGKGYRAVYLLNQHRRIHEERPFACPDCSKRFVTATNLRLHQQLHTGDLAFSCSICCEKFRWWSALDKHKQQVHNIDRKLLRPAKPCRVGPFRCTTCGKEYVNLYGLLDHELTHSGKPADICTICGKTFVKRTTYRKHLLDHHNELKQMYTCSQCSRIFKRKAHLFVHEKTHAGVKLFLCTKCGRKFSHNKELDEHLCCHGERQYTCSYCGKKFSSSMSVKCHELTHSEQRNFTCVVCFKKFKNRKSLSNHTLIHKPNHPEVPENRTQQKMQPKTMHKKLTSSRKQACSHCGQYFVLKNATIDYHERARVCSCGKIFECMTYLTNHQQADCSRYNLSCDLCKRRFRFASNLCTHKNLIHGDGNKPFGCTECGKTFTKKEHLQVHSLIHTRPNGQYRFACDLCQMRFHSNTTLGTHYRSTHAGHQNPLFECMTCAKYFSSSKELRRHKLSVHQFGECQCTTCGKHFSCRSKLERHELVHVRRGLFQKPATNSFFANDNNKAVEPTVVDIEQFTSCITRSVADRPIEDPASSNTKEKNEPLSKIFDQQHVEIDECNNVATKSCQLSNSLLSESLGVRNHKPAITVEDPDFNGSNIYISAVSEHDGHDQNHESAEEVICSEMVADHLVEEVEDECIVSTIVVNESYNEHPETEMCNYVTITESWLPNELPETMASERTDPELVSFLCTACGLHFSSSDQLRSHEPIHVEENRLFCLTCGWTCVDASDLSNHEVIHGISQSNTLEATQLISKLSSHQPGLVLYESSTWEPMHEISNSSTVEANHTISKLRTCTRDFSVSSSIKSIPDVFESNTHDTTSNIFVSNTHEASQGVLRSKPEAIQDAFESNTHEATQDTVFVSSTHDADHSFYESSALEAVHNISDSIDIGASEDAIIVDHGNEELFQGSEAVHFNDLLKSGGVQMFDNQSMLRQHETFFTADSIVVDHTEDINTLTQEEMDAESIKIGVVDSTEFIKILPKDKDVTYMKTSHGSEISLHKAIHSMSESSIHQATQLISELRSQKSSLVLSGTYQPIPEISDSNTETDNSDATDIEISYGSEISEQRNTRTVHLRENDDEELIENYLLPEPLQLDDLCSQIERLDAENKQTDMKEIGSNLLTPFRKLENDEIAHDQAFLHIKTNCKLRKSKSIEQLLTYVCTKCDVQFNSKALLQIHESVHNYKRKHICNVCGRRFAVPRGLREHECIDPDKRSFPCTECNRTFLEPSSLKNHHRGVHAKQKQYSCPICDQKFDRCRQLKRHRCKEQCIVPNENDTKKKRSPYSYLCALCGKMYSSKSLAFYHRERHLHVDSKDITLKHSVRKNRASFLCTLCGKVCDSVRNFQNHERMHSKIRPFPCMDCGKAFTSQGNLTRHILKHADERPHVCDICSKRFVLQSELKRHLERHGVPKFKCTECSKGFHSKQNLSMHMFRHSKRSAFSCYKCQRYFITDAELKRHLSRHTDELNNEHPFVCETCNRSFTGQRSYRTHLATHQSQ